MALGMEMGLGPGHIVLHGNPAPLPKRGRGPAPQFFAHFYCGQTGGCIKTPLGTEVGLSPRDFVLDWAQPPFKGGGAPSPKFSAGLYCGQTAGCIKMPLGMEVGLSPRDFVLDLDPAAPSQKQAEPGGEAPQFSAHVYCGQTARWIKMALGMEIGLVQSTPC